MASSSALAYIKSIGARGPLGLSPLSMAMCARARKLEPQSIGLRDKRGNPIGICLTPGLPETLTGYDRLLALGAPALQEAMGGEVLDGGAGIPVALALAEPAGPHHAEWMERDIVSDLAALTGIPLDSKRSIVLHQGHAAGSLTLEAALALMVREGVKNVLWGGVDTFLHPGRLRFLDEECRLMALGAEDGFIPSEGAAWLLLSLGDSKPKDAGGQRPFAGILGVDNENEDSISKNEPNIAKALTSVIRKAHDHIGGKIPWLLSDLSGEKGFVREMQFAMMRGTMSDGHTHNRFLDDFGDMGAASGPTLAMLACMHFRLGCAPSRTATIALQSDGEARGTFVLEDSAP